MPNAIKLGAVAYGGKAVIRAASPLLSTRGTPKFAREGNPTASRRGAGNTHESAGSLATSLRALFVAPLLIISQIK